MILLLLILYFVIGFFVAKKYAEMESAEVFGAFMAIWPILALGSVTEKVLKRLGLFISNPNRDFTCSASLPVFFSVVLYLTPYSAM